MNEADARRLLLVRAVETEDAAEALLTRDDRRHATEAARAQLAGAGAGGRAAAESFLARRAAFALERLEPRYPAVGTALRRARWPGWIGWLLPLAALLLGLATNEIDSGKRLNLIAFPLLGMLAWNAAVYALLLAGALRRLLRRGGAARPNPAARLLERWAGPAERAPGAQPALAAALARFARDWVRQSSRLTYARASRTLHVAAAALAAGVLLGMYARALGIEYRAGWESTFIDTGALHRLLGLALGPASALTGIALPGPDQLAALRWSAGPGENAARWIHLHAVTACLFIIGPRLALAAWHALAALRLGRRFPVPGREDFYIRRLLRSAEGQGSLVRILPYAFHPPQAHARKLERLLADLLGDKARIAIEPPVAYGEEDEWLAAAASAPQDEADQWIAWFNLASTPEAENHGAFAAGLAARSGGAGLALLLDESAYRARLAGQSGAEGRLAARRSAWTAMLGQAGLAPLSLDLEADEPAALARALEAALLDSARQGVRR